MTLNPGPRPRCSNCGHGMILDCNEIEEDPLNGQVHVVDWHCRPCGMARRGPINQFPFDEQGCEPLFEALASAPQPMGDPE